MISVSAHSNQADFDAAIKEYLRVTKRAPGAALKRQAKKLAWDIHDGFKLLRPKQGSIYAGAVSREFRTRRRGNSLTPAISGISRAAWRRADSLLDGRSSQLFKLIDSGVGSMPRLRRLRFSGVPRKIRNLNDLRGGRRGNRFAKSALAADEVNPIDLQEWRKSHPEARRLNRRALATYAELMYRERAAGGGTLAVQWLPSVFKNRNSSTVKSGGLVQNKFNGRTLGEVRLIGDGADGLAAVELTGYVPGSVKQNRRHNVVNRALAARAADMRVHIADVLAGRAKKP